MPFLWRIVDLQPLWEQRGNFEKQDVAGSSSTKDRRSRETFQRFISANRSNEACDYFTIPLFSFKWQELSCTRKQDYRSSLLGLSDSSFLFELRFPPKAKRTC
jgi:hypothetical protein